MRSSTRRLTESMNNAFYSEQWQQVRQLIQQGASLLDGDENGIPFGLQLIQSAPDKKCVQLLQVAIQNSPSELIARDASGDNVLHYALRYGKYEVVLWLLSLIQSSASTAHAPTDEIELIQSSPNGVDQYQYGDLKYYKGTHNTPHTPYLKLVTQTNHQGFSPSFYALLYGQGGAKVAHWLIMRQTELGFDINHTGVDHSNLLHLSIQKSQGNLTDYLIQKGVSLLQCAIQPSVAISSPARKTQKMYPLSFSIKKESMIKFSSLLNLAKEQATKQNQLTQFNAMCRVLLKQIQEHKFKYHFITHMRREGRFLRQLDHRGSLVVKQCFYLLIIHSGIGLTDCHDGKHYFYESDLDFFNLISRKFQNRTFQAQLGINKHLNHPAFEGLTIKAINRSHLWLAEKLISLGVASKVIADFFIKKLSEQQKSFFSYKWESHELLLIIQRLKKFFSDKDILIVFHKAIEFNHMAIHRLFSPNEVVQAARPLLNQVNHFLQYAVLLYYSESLAKPSPDSALATLKTDLTQAIEESVETGKWYQFQPSTFNKQSFIKTLGDQLISTISPPEPRDAHPLSPEEKVKHSLLQEKFDRAKRLFYPNTKEACKARDKVISYLLGKTIAQKRFQWCQPKLAQLTAQAMPIKREQLLYFRAQATTARRGNSEQAPNNPIGATSDAIPRAAVC